MTEEWKKKESFEVTDVRELTGNLLPMLLKKPGKLPCNGDGMCIVHSFELVPLKPLALLNVKEIGNGLADLTVHFWGFV